MQWNTSMREYTNHGSRSESGFEFMLGKCCWPCKTLCAHQKVAVRSTNRAQPSCADPLRTEWTATVSASILYAQVCAFFATDGIA